MCDYYRSLIGSYIFLLIGTAVDDLDDLEGLFRLFTPRFLLKISINQSINLYFRHMAHKKVLINVSPQLKLMTVCDLECLLRVIQCH